MALTGVYGATDGTESLATLHNAIDIGVRMIDTANIYGEGENEKLIAELLRGRRAEVLVATKFGIPSTPDPDGFRARGDRDYVHHCVKESLDRLKVDVIDLYYYHRVDPRTPIEETIGALAELVAAGHLRHIGLSEVAASELRRANSVHPIAAVQSEWSLWSRDVEAEIVPTAAELGVSFVPYSPLGRGFLTGAAQTDLAPDDLRLKFPRFTPEHLKKNQTLFDAVASLATAHGITPPRRRSPGSTRRVAHLGCLSFRSRALAAPPASTRIRRPLRSSWTLTRSPNLTIWRRECTAIAPTTCCGSRRGASAPGDSSQVTTDRTGQDRAPSAITGTLTSTDPLDVSLLRRVAPPRVLSSSSSHDCFVVQPQRMKLPVRMRLSQEAAVHPS